MKVYDMGCCSPTRLQKFTQTPYLGYVGITLWIVYSIVSFFHFFPTSAFTFPISHGSFISPE